MCSFLKKESHGLQCAKELMVWRRKTSGSQDSGKDYTLVGCESEEYIQKVALYIDKR